MSAGGEFALVWDYLKVIGSKPVSARGLLFHDNELYSMCVDLAARQRDEAALRHYAPLAEETAVRDGHILYQAIAHRAWGVLYRLQGEYAAAEARLQQALALFEGLETRWQTGRTLYELAKLSRLKVDVVEARNYYYRAHAAFAEIGAVPDMRRTETELQSLN